MVLSFKSKINYLLEKALHKISIKYKHCFVYACPHCDWNWCLYMYVYMGREEYYILTFSLDVFIKKMLKSQHDQFLMDLKS